MKQIKTEILIDAPVTAVWKILTDFDSYPDWNPFIKLFEGKPSKGERFTVVIQPPNAKPMQFKPVCLEMTENKKFSWLGHLFIKGLFDGEHIFELIEDSGKTIFIQRENFSGLLVPLIWKQMDTKTIKGFEMMNRSLKERAEGFTQKTENQNGKPA